MLWPAYCQPTPTADLQYGACAGQSAQGAALSMDHGLSEFDENTAECAVQPVELGRRNYLFMGSKAGGKSAAIAYTLIETCKRNRVNYEAWFAWMLERIQDHFCRWLCTKVAKPSCHLWKSTGLVATKICTLCDGWIITQP